jgi:hypothetical protein
MTKLPRKNADWKKTAVQVFWGEIAPCDHVVQIYETDEIFLNTLENFAADGLAADESVIIIGTSIHLGEINQRLIKKGYDVDELIASHRYFPLDAFVTLSRFMVNDWPDEDLFQECINSVIMQSTKRGRKVRAFGEMVAILWAEGKNGATVRLENLWNELHAKKNFSLYCAYPKSGFTQNLYESVNHICNAHSKIVDGQISPSTQIYYRSDVAGYVPE